MSFDHVTKQYRDVVAVCDVSLDIDDGEMLMLLGPSGCGKTTVLRLIAGLEHPDAGIVRFDDEDVSAVPPAERNIAMVFEGYALYPHMAVRDNLAFALRLRKLSNEVVGRRVSEVADAMELGHLLARRPGGLATGEAQTVAVGRAVIREAPSVLLLDNALSHLDAQQRLEARVEVSRLHHDIGCTVVSVTHDQAEALAVGTRIAVLDDGVLQQVGTPHDLYERPGNTFVAGFIGDPPMNLVRVQVDRRDGQDVLRAGALELPLPGPIAGAEVVVGFRPQDVQLAPARHDGAGGFLGRCELVEHLGADSLVHLRVGADEVIASDHRVSEIRVGEMVGASVPVTRLHLFDAATGVAIA